MKNKLIVSVIFLMISCMAQAALVAIGEAGNAADTNGYGAVAYAYKISPYEVTITNFMDSGAGNGNENFWIAAGLTAPAANVSLYEAMKYCNWLTSGNILLGAYQFDGSGTLTNAMSRTDILADGGLFYLLPTEDEWYKAAYFKGGTYSLYANGLNTAPTTAQSKYGDSTTWAVGSGLQELNSTYDMMGNVYEWTEGGVLRGGYWGSVQSDLSAASSLSVAPGTEATGGGFRIVAIPEPATALLFGLGGMGAWMLRRNKMKNTK
jgi:sulfatase modifying factor 1